MAQSSQTNLDGYEPESFSGVGERNPYVRYGSSNGEGDFWQEDYLQRVSKPIPDQAKSVSPVYLLPESCEEEAEFDVGRMPKEIQDECEEDGSVWNFLYLETPWDVFGSRDSRRAEIKDFISGELPVSIEDCAWYKEGSQGIVAIPPLLVSEERRELLRKKIENQYEIRSIPLYRKSQNKLYELYSTPDTDESMFSPSSSVVSFGDIIRNRCVERDGNFSIALWGVGPEIVLVSDEFEEQMGTTVEVGQGNLNKYKGVDVFEDIDMSIELSETVDEVQEDLPESIIAERGQGGQILNVHEVIKASQDYLNEKVENVEDMSWSKKGTYLDISYISYMQGARLLQAAEEGDEAAQEEWEAIDNGKPLSRAYSDYMEKKDEEESRSVQEDTTTEVEVKPAEKDSSGAIVDGYSVMSRGLQKEPEVAEAEGITSRARLDEVMSERLGMSQRSYRRGRILFESAEKGDEAAIREREALKDGQKAITTASRDWRNTQREEDSSEDDTQTLRDEQPVTEKDNERKGIVDRILSFFGLQRV